MHRCFCAVLVLATAAPNTTHSQASAASPPRLSTTYMINRTKGVPQVFLRVTAPSSVPSVSVVLQTDLTKCDSKVTGNFTGHALQMTGGYTSHPPAATACGHRRMGDGVPGRELFNVTWRPVEETLLVTLPKTTFSLAAGNEGEAEGKWWRLWVRNGGQEEVASSGDPSPHQPNQGGEAGGARAGRGVLMHTYTADSIWGLAMDILLLDERRRLLNLTVTAHQGTQWQTNIQVPPLSVALDWESRISQSHGRQHRQVAGEIRSSKSGASLKFFHYDKEKQDKEAQTAEDNGETDGRCEVGGCGDGGIGDPQRKSRHLANSYRGPDVGIFRKLDLNDVGSGPEHTPMEDLKERLRYEDDPDSIKTKTIEKFSKEAADVGLRESMSSDATQEIRQKITSNMFSSSGNMTTFALPDGGRSIRIQQHVQLAFCPRLSWTMNQIFRFRSDWSGWEYVVSTWEWGSMVVRGEWGTSLLQWYQKTFTFSFDQAAALPSTQLVLDFRDWRSFKVWVRWPALASALAASLTLENDCNTLQVEEVDEFAGEGDAEVVARVVTRRTPSGLALSCFADTSRIKKLHVAAAARLAQAVSHPDVCGEAPDHSTVKRFLYDLLGQSPASLWAHLLQEGRRLLLGAGFTVDMYDLSEVLDEEMKTAGGAAGLWELAWTWLEEAGLLSGRGEELEVLVPWEWVKRAQDWWGRAVEVDGERCEDGTPVDRLLAVLRETLRQGGH